IQGFVVLHDEASLSQLARHHNGRNATGANSGAPARFRPPAAFAPLILGPQVPIECAETAFGELSMNTMKDRKDAFENKFAHDEELKFKAMARRNKLLGLWAAEKMGKSGEEAEAYAKEVVAADFEEVGDDDVFRKIRKDFDANGVDESDHQIRRTMEELLEEAARQVKEGL